MAYIEDLLYEIKIGNNKNIESLFNYMLSQIFDEAYLKKIEMLLNNKVIKIIEKEERKDIVAWTVGTTIYVNPDEFNARNIESQIKYLLHEFIHVLNNSKSFFILNKFKEIKELSKTLWKITLEHSDNPGKFLTNKNINKNLLNDQEALSYIMNGNLNWAEISSKGRKLFIEAIKQSNIFNLDSKFWKERLKI